MLYFKNLQANVITLLFIYAVTGAGAHAKAVEHTFLGTEVVFKHTYLNVEPLLNNPKLTIPLVIISRNDPFSKFLVTQQLNFLNQNLLTCNIQVEQRVRHVVIENQRNNIELENDFLEIKKLAKKLTDNYALVFFFADTSLNNNGVTFTDPSTQHQQRNLYGGILSLKRLSDLHYVHQFRANILGHEILHLALKSTSHTSEDGLLSSGGLPNNNLTGTMGKTITPAQCNQIVKLIEMIK